MPRFMVIQTMSPAALTRERVRQFEEAIQDSSLNAWDKQVIKEKCEGEP